MIRSFKWKCWFDLCRCGWSLNIASLSVSLFSLSSSHLNVSFFKATTLFWYTIWTGTNYCYTQTVQIHFQIPQRNNRSAPVSPRKAAKIEEARSILHIPEYQEVPSPARRVIRYREVANQHGYPDLGINMMWSIAGTDAHRYDRRLDWLVLKLVTTKLDAKLLLLRLEGIKSCSGNDWRNAFQSREKSRNSFHALSTVNAPAEA